MSINKKITFVIPTWERSDQLDECIESIFTAAENSSLNVSIVISDNFSEKELTNKQNIIDSFKSESGPKIIYKQQETFLAWNDNLLSALEMAIKENADYYWTFGDDDIVLPESIKAIELLLKKENNFSGLIHPSSYRQSIHSQKSQKTSLWNAVNSYGFNEILGHMSSNIFSHKILEKIITLKEWNNVYYKSSFTHAHALLHVAVDTEIILLHSPMIDNQKNTNQKEIQERWAFEKISSGYYEIPSAVKYQIHNNILPKKVSNMFFRYLNFNLWDRLIKQETIKMLQSENSFNNENWSKIQLIADCLEDLNTRKLILVSLVNIQSQVYKSSNISNYLQEMLNFHNSSAFPLEVWHSDPQEFEIMNHGIICSKDNRIYQDGR